MIVMVVGLTTVTITTKFTDHAHGEILSIQNYVIKFSRDLRLFGGFLHQ